MIKINPNPKKKSDYKYQCHILMEDIWGSDRKRRTLAYLWIRNKFGKDIHFSTLEDEYLLKKIWTELWIKSFYKK